MMNGIEKMEHITFERELPEGYSERKHVNAKSFGFGLVMNLIALAIFAAVTVPLVLMLNIRSDAVSVSSFTVVVGVYVGVFASLIYLVLHELVHGWAYKKRTGEKLTFGLSWSCAYCGVPNIYTYRRTALFAVLAPFVFFSAVMVAVGAASFAVYMCAASDIAITAAALVFVANAVVFGLHLGGCSGDLYVTLLLLTKFKDDRALMRDTGPEMFLYLPDSNIQQTE